MVLDFLPTLLLMKFLHFLKLPKMSFLNWRNTDPFLITANKTKRCCKTFLFLHYIPRKGTGSK